MALVLKDRVKETTTTAGNGVITLAGAATGYQSFAVIGNTNTTYYCIAGQTSAEWEVGIGTYATSGTTLTRTTVIANSAGTEPTALVFSAGTKDVFCTYPAEKSVNQDAAGIVTLPSGSTLIAPFLGVASATSLAITGTAGAGFQTFVGQSSNPANPAAGTLLVHAKTVNGFTRLEQDNESATNVVYARDNVFIAENPTGSTIPKGSTVYVSGTVSGAPQVQLARANSSSTLPCVGITTDAILAGGFGQVMYAGLLTFDTTAFSTGNQVWVSTSTAGALTATRPSGTTNSAQRMGTILVSGNSTTGLMLVQTSPTLLNMETGTNAATWTGTNVVATTYNGNTLSTGSSTFTGTAAQVYTFPSVTSTLLATDGSAASLTSFPTFNQNTSGTAAGLSSTLAIASGGTNKTSYTAKSGNVAGLIFFDGTSLVNDTTVSDAGYDTATNTLIGKNISTPGTITSTLATGTAPFTITSTTNVANLNASSLNGATFAAPGAIGGTTAAASTFTSVKIGALGYTPANALITAQSSATSFNQVIISNTNAGTAASTDYIVNNFNSTDTTYYGDFGMNGSGFTGSGAFSQANNVYLTSTTADLAIGTTTSNAIHFVINGGATDAATISTAGVFSLATALATSSGGTGVANNAASTITVSGNFASTFVVSGAYSYTFPGATSTLLYSGGALGTPASGTLSSCTADGTDAVGFRNIPQNAQTGNYGLVLADSGKHIYHASGAGAAAYTIPAAASVAYPIGTAISFVNLSATSITIVITTDTMYLGGTGTTGTRTLAQYGTATALKVSGLSSSGIWIITGSGLT